MDYKKHLFKWWGGGDMTMEWCLHGFVLFWVYCIVIQYKQVTNITTNIFDNMSFVYVLNIWL